MAWGMIVRNDMGGLANQTHAMWKELKPDRTLIAHVPDPRGRERSDWYRSANIWSAPTGQITNKFAQNFCQGLDAVVSVEGFYGRGFENREIRTVLVANPELYTKQDHSPNQIITPTPWELGRMPREAQMIPHPTSAPPIERFRVRESIDTFLHCYAPAMLDRNGTNIVMQTCGHMRERCDLVIRAPGRNSPDRGQNKFKVGNVTVYWDSRFLDEWWQNYDVEADCLVLPRRYGGLCLPAQEAASCGMPNLMTDLMPQTLWPGWRVRAHRASSYPMKGGPFGVYAASPIDLAAEMDALVRGDRNVLDMSQKSAGWASDISWPCLRNVWKTAIGCV